VILKRSQIIFLHDLLLINFSFNFALGIRLLDEISLYKFSTGYFEYSSVFFLVSSVFLYFSKLYQRSWRYSSEKDYLFVVQTCLAITMIYSLAMFFINRLTGVPRSVIVVNCFLMPMLLIGTRILYKLFKLQNTNKILDQAIPVLIVGLDNRIELFLREVFLSGNSPYLPIGIIDNNKTKIGSKIYNVQVYGTLGEFEKIYSKLKVKGILPKRLIVTEQYCVGEYFKQLIKISDSYGIKLGRLPQLTELHYKLEKSSSSSQPIIIEDLLPREQNFLNKDQLSSFLNKKIVLVTGAGGTIGGELVRQIVDFKPKKLIVLDSSEFNLYKIINELKSVNPALQFSSYVTDIRDKIQLERVFLKEHPEIVFHAAALKHVPIVEENIIEGIMTNIFGTVNIATLALKYQSESMIFISTDKAVNPTNVLGATKRIAEKYLQGIGQKYVNKKTNFVSVRFGNVLGSSGSVIPMFEQQISAGGPITVTDPKIERYFMTLREAVQLVLQAGKQGSISDNVSHSHVYVLDMGKPVKIKDLAQQMIELSGLKVGIDINIEYTGLRPGEKLYEELFYKDEYPEPTEYKSVMVARPQQINFDQLNIMLKKLNFIATSKDVTSNKEIKMFLKKIISEYNQS
jgi:O-antigen biosynthesis protein WbqV